MGVSIGYPSACTWVVDETPPPVFSPATSSSTTQSDPSVAIHYMCVLGNPPLGTLGKLYPLEMIPRSPIFHTFLAMVLAALFYGDSH